MKKINNVRLWIFAKYDTSSLSFKRNISYSEAGMLIDWIGKSNEAYKQREYSRAFYREQAAVYLAEKKRKQLLRERKRKNKKGN